MEILVNIGNIDWELLKEQKAALLDVLANLKNDKQEKLLEGILGLIDSIQDEAVDAGLSESLVFSSEEE